MVANKPIKRVMVSCPTNGYNPKTGKYDSPVMEMLQQDMKKGLVSIAYSFAGDSIPYIDTQELQQAYPLSHVENNNPLNPTSSLLYSTFCVYYA